MTDHDLSRVLSAMLEDLPQVVIEKKANHISFLVGKKVFAYTRDQAVVMKLPQETVKVLVDKEYGSPLVMGKRVMKAWVVIQHKHPAEYEADIELFKEAIACVSPKS